MTRQRLMILLAVLLMGLTLSACGKKPGLLKPPVDEKGGTTFHTYPATKDDL